MPQRRLLTLALALAAGVLACADPLPTVPALLTPFIPPTFTSAPPTTPAPASATAVPASATVEPPSATAQPSATPPAPTDTAAPVATPVTYVVAAGDGFLAIATRFGLTGGQLRDANPAIDPDALQPGDVLVIPDPSVSVPNDARVMLRAGGLRVRAWPDLSADVVARLPALTGLSLLGRSSDNDWVEISAPAGATGWVPALWLDLKVSLVHLPVSTPAAPPATAVPLPAGYVSNVTLRMLGVYQRGQALGNRANVFSKIGDSITVNTAFLVPIGEDNYSLGSYTDLQPVIDYFSAAEVRGGLNAFANRSLSAKVGWRARAVFSTAGDPQPGCDAGEMPIACEYRVVRPAVALIMLGTNDVPYTPDDEFESDLRYVLDYTLGQGIIPVLSTIPPFTRTDGAGRAEELNAILRALALEYGVPLLDYYAAMPGLPNEGIGGDGVHPTIAPDTRNADFSPDHLQYGMVVRNLTALYALYEVWDKILKP